MVVSQAKKCRITRILTVICCAVLVLAQALPACTTFCLKDDEGLVFGRNYDWHLDHGLVIVNKRNVTKRALLIDPEDTPARWISKYGSVTFNQYGREFPIGGMVEGERPADAARKELREEAGLLAEDLQALGSFAPYKGVSNELTHFFLARDLTRTAQELEPSEGITVHVMPLAEARARILEQEVGDGQSLAGLMLLDRFLARGS